MASLGRVAISFIAAIAVMAALLSILPRTPFARRIVLTAGGPTAVALVREREPERSWIGVVGSALTPLRPSGTARLDGERVDVVAEGEFVSAGAAIEVIKQEGSRVVVRPTRAGHDEGGPERAKES